MRFLSSISVLACAFIVKTSGLAVSQKPHLIAQIDSFHEDITFSSERKDNFYKEPPTDQTILSLINNEKTLTHLSATLDSFPDAETLLNSDKARVTIFAPNDMAFSRPPHLPVDEEALFYHILPKPRSLDSLQNGELLASMLIVEELGNAPQKIPVTILHNDGTFLGRARIVKSYAATNGYLHIIDRTLPRPVNVVKTLAAKPLKYSILLLALKRAQLDDVLSSSSSITLFAPTNIAFRRLGFWKLRYLFSDAGSTDLKKILKKHVSPKLTYTDAILSAGDITIPSLQDGDGLHLEVRDEKDEDGHTTKVIEVNEAAHVTEADIIAENGVAQGIDHVLSLEILANQGPIATGELSDFERALSELIAMETE